MTNSTGKSISWQSIKRAYKKIRVTTLKKLSNMDLLTLLVLLAPDSDLSPEITKLVKTLSVSLITEEIQLRKQKGKFNEIASASAPTLHPGDGGTSVHGNTDSGHLQSEVEE